ncbi:MAG: DUF2306 domain-containing protein [Bacteroidia bacterium]|nr:DUF2306 domain-containing protein [Bacteroidia bacterium]
MIHHLTGSIHTLAAVIALITGAWVILRPKGGLRHRQAGYVYAAAMLIVNLTAFMIYDLWGRPGPFHVAALVSVVTLILGLRAAWQQREGWFVRHYYWMAWSVVGLYGAFVAEMGVRLVPMRSFWAAVLLSVTFVMMTGSWLIKRHAPDRQPSPEKS